MKQIINYLPLVFICLFYLNSCSKKDVASPEPAREGPGTISVSIDGSTRSFNYNADPNTTAKARLGTGYPNFYELVVYGQEATGWFVDDISIKIDSPDPIVPGTYSFNTGLNTRTEIWYCPAVIPLEPCHVSGSSGIITITDISPSFVKATFSATVTYVDNSNVFHSNTLTNGKFNALF
jgi:hypothetical protein